MKALIVGSRSITEFDLSKIMTPDVEMIISGGAKGVDALAERYADEHKLSKLIMRPRYDRYGRAAPLKRNEQMVDMADVVLVLWDGVSRGAQYTIRYAEHKGKPITVIKIEQ